MAGQRRILATSVAGLQAAVDSAVTRVQSTITGTVLAAVRGQIATEVATAVGELPPATGGGSISYRSADVDLGTRAKREHWTTIVDPDVTAETVVLATIAPTVAGKDDDEPGMDVIDVWCVASPGQIAVRVTGLTGRISRQFRIDYLLTEG